MIAIDAWADAAGYADPCRCACGGQVEPVCINKLARVIDLTPQSDSITPRRSVIATRGFHQAFGHRNIAHPIGRFGKLDKDAVRDRDGLMDNP